MLDADNTLVGPVMEVLLKEAYVNSPTVHVVSRGRHVGAGPPVAFSPELRQAPQPEQIGDTWDSSARTAVVYTCAW